MTHATTHTEATDYDEYDDEYETEAPMYFVHDDAVFCDDFTYGAAAWVGLKFRELTEAGAFVEASAASFLKHDSFKELDASRFDSILWDDFNEVVSDTILEEAEYDTRYGMFVMMYRVYLEAGISKTHLTQVRVLPVPDGVDDDTPASWVYALHA